MRILTLTALLAACPAVADTTADPLTRLGKALFFDTNLSINGTQSCASCHDPAAGFAASGPALMTGALGGVGSRKPPSAAYAFASPPLHHIPEEGAPLFLGGLFHDGRATGAQTGQPIADQAAGPILNPDEMALPNPACAVKRACETSGLGQAAPEACASLATLTPCEAPVAEDVSAAFTLMQRALAAYEASAEVSAFASPYDDWVAGKGSLTADQLFGLALFNGKAKCAACHVIDSPGAPGLFTDFTYDNLGLPAASAQSAAPDFGVADTLAADPVYAAFAPGMQGKFKVPTLRNVAAGEGRHYMHNGYFQTLAGVVRFYNTRDIWPLCQSWRPEAQAIASHCWPAAELPATVNHDELGNLGLTPTEEAQILAFLASLTDAAPHSLK